MDYAAKGGIVVVTKRLPSLAPGLQDAADTAQIRALAASIKIHFVADDKTTGKTLADLLQPDLATNEPAIGFVHGKLDSADLYFVANTGNRPVHTKALTRAKNVAAEWWDPFSGNATTASLADLKIDLEPYESRVLILSPESSAPQPVHATEAEPRDISTGWNVTFANIGPVIGDLREIRRDIGRRPNGHSRLWTRHASCAVENGQRHARMARSPRARIRRGLRRWHAGGLRVASTIPSRHHEAGEAPGSHRIRIVVANTAINELAGQSLPDYKLLKLRFGDRFQPQDMDNLKPLPSGIPGAIHLVSR